MSLRAFTCRDAVFMRRVFVAYVRPLLEYGAVAWSPTDVASIALIESVQRRFTKRIDGFYNYTYEERLQRLNLPSLKIRRDNLTLCFVYKVLHKMLNVNAEDVGLQLSCANTRSVGIKLFVHRPLCSLFKTSFIYRSTALWNALPFNILNARNIIHFKKLLSEGAE